MDVNTKFSSALNVRPNIVNCEAKFRLHYQTKITIADRFPTIMYALFPFN